MHFMVLMIPAVYRDNEPLDPGYMPDAKQIEEMTRFNEEMGKSLKILALNGLYPLHDGVRVSFGEGKPVVTDGPFIEVREVVGGYWIVEAESRDELLAWVKRCPAQPGDTIEIRQIFGEADFASAE